VTDAEPIAEPCITTIAQRGAARCAPENRPCPFPNESTNHELDPHATPGKHTGTPIPID